MNGPHPAASGAASTRRGRLKRRLLPPTLAVLLGVLLGVAAAAMIRMPRVDSLEDYTPGLITRLLDREGAVFATYAREKRVLLDEGELPELLQQAVLAAEDSNFFQHGGVDAGGVLRAAIRNLGEGRMAQGGSTITMQLARQLFLTPRKTWRRKAEEALLAVELEKNYSKQQILTFYCNLVFLGHGNYGMKAAARSYFDKEVGELTLPEAAVLAGIPQRPSAYSPYRRPDLVLKRRDYVLRRMSEEGFITAEQFVEASSQPLTVVEPRPRTLFGPYFAEEVRRHLESAYGSEALLRKGLEVETTLDPVIQRAAEKALRQGLLDLDHRRGWRGVTGHVEPGEMESFEAPSWSRSAEAPGELIEGLVLEADGGTARVRIRDRVWELDADGIRWTRKPAPRSLLRAGDVAWFAFEGEGEERRLLLEQEPELEGAVLVIESATGAIRALVGGWSFDRSSFNRATQARRQVGSAFKPFVYGAALESGFTPADTIFDAPAVFPDAQNRLTYSPRNFYRRYYGITTLRRALELSMNVSTAKLMDMVGVERVIDFARRCGITSPLPPYPSLALGSAELSPLEVAASFAAIANQGIHVEPYLIERVSTPEGVTLEEHRTRAHQAMTPEIAAVLTQMLEGVIDRGTGTRVADLEIDLAGKTGTTDRYIDAWFVGFSPRYTLLSWVGHDVSRTIGRRMTGAEAALPIWRSVMVDGLEQGWLSRGETFVRPPGVLLVPVEYSTGLLPGPGADRIVPTAFVAGTEPARQYEPRWRRILELPWYQQRPFYLAKSGERMPEQVEDWTPVREAWSEKAEGGG